RLLILTTFDDTARRLWAELIIEHPNSDVREAVAESIYGFGYQPSKASPAVDTRKLYWDALLAKKLPVRYLDRALVATKPDDLRALSDEEVLREFSLVVDRANDAVVNMYVDEIVQRRLV